MSSHVPLPGDFLPLAAGVAQPLAATPSPSYREHVWARLRADRRAMLSLAVIAALIIGSSIVMTVPGGPTLLGLPAFGFLGFCGAVIGGVWLVRAIVRSHRQPPR